MSMEDDVLVKHRHAFAPATYENLEVLHTL